MRARRWSGRQEAGSMCAEDFCGIKSQKVHRLMARASQSFAFVSLSRESFSLLERQKRGKARLLELAS